MKSMNSKPLYALVLLALTLPGCSSESPGEQAMPAEQRDADQPTNRIDIPATVRRNLGITFAPVQRRKVASTIRVPGAFELEPLARHEYRMVLPGEVELRVDQYQAVQPGDLLYRFRSPQWPELQHEIITSEQAIASAEADIAVAQSKIDEAQARLALLNQRLSALEQAEIKNADLQTQAKEVQASLPRLRAELQQARTTLANARRTREHALHVASTATQIEENRLSAMVEHDGEAVPAYQAIDWIEVHATRPGVVEKLALTDGSFAQAPSLVLSTVDPQRVRFRAMAMQSDLAHLRDRAQAVIVPPASPGIPIEDSVPAQMTLGLEAHPDQRTVALLASPEQTRGWIRPGVSAFLEVTTDSTEGYALAIPESAIVKDGIVHVFFRRDRNDPNKAVRVEADRGVSDGRWVAINSGLSLNDEVVLDGAYELKLASEQSGTSQKGGHFHADGTFHEEDH